MTTEQERAARALASERQFDADAARKTMSIALCGGLSLAVLGTIVTVTGGVAAGFIMLGVGFSALLVWIIAFSVQLGLRASRS